MIIALYIAGCSIFCGMQNVVLHGDLSLETYSTGHAYGTIAATLVPIAFLSEVYNSFLNKPDLSFASSSLKEIQYNLL